MSWASQTDEALLRGCLREDFGAWNEFVTRFSRLIYWSIGQVFKDSSFGLRPDLVEDIFQDVFRKILEKETLGGLKDADHLKKFLVVLSTHQTLDRIKSISRLEAKSLFIDGIAPDQDGGVETPDVSAQQNEVRTVVSEVIDELSLKERACLELHFFDGKTHQEVGLILGYSQDAVSSIIRRAKNKIKEKLSKKDLF